jgi:hypothetical protein
LRENTVAFRPHRFKRRLRRAQRAGFNVRFGTRNNPGFFSPGGFGRVILPPRYVRPT